MCITTKGNIGNYGSQTTHKCETQKCEGKEEMSESELYNKGDIREINIDWSEIFIDGKWYKGKKIYQRVQGELEQFHDFMIYKGKGD